MKTAWDKLNDFLTETGGSIAYNDEQKKKFQRLGRAALKQLATKLESTGIVSKTNIDYNKGGIAVSGDFHLRGDYFVSGGSFDLFFNCDGFGRFYTYRRTKHQKDYTGDVNNQMPFGISLEDAVDRLITLNNWRTNSELTF